jgi:hypothetical protein
MIKEQPSVMEYIQFIADALQYDKFYATSYYIERDTTNYFALFFITAHIFGFEKILEVKWDLDEEAGRGFKIPSMKVGLFDDLFAEEEKDKNAAKLESILLELLAESKTNRQVYEETLKRGFLPKHVNGIFEKWQSNSNNCKFTVHDIKAGKDARKGAFYIAYKYYKDDKVLFKVEKL